MFEIFQERPPFNTRRLADLKTMIDSKPLVFLKKMDFRLKKLVRKLLKKNPVDRPSCKEILLDREVLELKENFQIFDDCDENAERTEPRHR